MKTRTSNRIKNYYNSGIQQIKGNKRFTYLFNAPYFLHKVIEMKTTNHLGWNTIRKKMNQLKHIQI